MSLLASLLDPLITPLPPGTKARPKMPPAVREKLHSAARTKTVDLFRAAMAGKGPMTMEVIGSHVPAKKDKTDTRSAVSVRHTLQLILEPNGYVIKAGETLLEGGFRKAFLYEWVDGK